MITCSQVRSLMHTVIEEKGKKKIEEDVGASTAPRFSSSSSSFSQPAVSFLTYDFLPNLPVT